MILVFAEQRNGDLKKASRESISEGRRLAAKMGMESVALLIGAGSGDAAAEAAKYGPSQIRTAQDVAAYSADAYATIAASVATELGATVILFPATAMGVDVAPRVAAALEAGLVTDITGLELDGGSLVATKPMYSGKAVATVVYESDVKIATLRSNVFPMEENPTDAPVSAVDVSGVTAGASVTETKVQEGGKVQLTEAEIIVSGGRGLKGPENFPMLQELADQLGAALGASRAAVDAGWIDHSHQVGQTGKVVSPKVYIACGISGAIQHLAGMGSSKFIIAINKDEDAPIFNLASLGVVGDLFKIVPALKEELAKAL